MKINKSTITLILIIVILTGTVFILKSILNNNVSAINISVFGQSIIGEKFTKTLSIINTNNVYYLSYACETKEPEKFCNCDKFEKILSNEEVEKFIKEVENLKDEGEKAKCCDHPWTEITLKYAFSREKSLTVSMEPIDIEKIFNIDCTTAK
jgi:hypothetical protein